MGEPPLLALGRLLGFFMDMACFSAARGSSPPGNSRFPSDTEPSRCSMLLVRSHAPTTPDKAVGPISV